MGYLKECLTIGQQSLSTGQNLTTRRVVKGNQCFEQPGRCYKILNFAAKSLVGALFCCYATSLGVKKPGPSAMILRLHQNKIDLQ